MKKVIIATLAVTSLALATSADAKPRRHAQHVAHAGQVQQANGTLEGGFSLGGFAGMGGGFGGSGLISVARSYTGTNPTNRSRQWCGEFLGLVVRKTGGKIPEGYALAKSWASLPRTSMHPGAIAVMSSHVGIVTGECENGAVRIVSGNHNRTVGEGCYPRGRIIAYVQP
jgi:uncharacterized protein (TIGR02594 family)